MVTILSAENRQSEQAASVPARRPNPLGTTIRPWQPAMRPAWRRVSRTIVRMAEWLWDFKVEHLERAACPAAK